MAWTEPKTDWSGGYVYQEDMARIFGNVNFLFNANIQYAYSFATKQEWGVCISKVKGAIQALGLGLRAPNYDITADNFNLMELDLLAIKERLDLLAQNKARQVGVSSTAERYVTDPASVRLRG